MYYHLCACVLGVGGWGVGLSSLIKRKHLYEIVFNFSVLLFIFYSRSKRAIFLKGRLAAKGNSMIDEY